MPDTNPTEASTVDEICDAVIERLTDGRGQATDPDTDACLYRTPDDGPPCAVGYLLTDEEYDAIRVAQAENLSAAVVPLPARLAPYRLLLSDLQPVHDDPTYWSGDVATDEAIARVNQIRDASIKFRS